MKVNDEKSAYIQFLQLAPVQQVDTTQDSIVAIVVV